VARKKANGIEIECETVGNKNDPALLLVMGLGAQLTIWPDALFEGLAKRGFFVIRFDNRDTGLSTDFGAWGVPNIAEALGKAMKGEKIEAPYLLNDMAADAVGLLDALGIDKAHMVGASMGGMIVQIVAAQHPERTRSMVSIMSTSGRPGLPPGKPGAGDADGATGRAGARAARQARHEAARPSPARAIPYRRQSRAPSSKRTSIAAGIRGAARQYLSVIASGDRVELLKTVKVPTLVLHGDDDPLLPVECGRDVARLVPGAEIETYPGWGHDLPGTFLPTLIDAS
jgi:pimeloyl-ACP methyl ester carboxylesterase